MRNLIAQLFKKSQNNQPFSKDEALEFISLPHTAVHEILYVATEIRQQNFKNKISTCSIVNAKSGKCSENCIFCAQSAHYNTSIESYDMLSSEEILTSAEKEKHHSLRHGIVTSGHSLNKNEITQLAETLKIWKNNTVPIHSCASCGILSKDDLRLLKDAGLERYHHNIESCQNFFRTVTTTHSWQERLNTIKAAQEVGLEVCVGGILGLGESLEDRVDFLCEISDIDPDTVPINFLNPIEGTPLEHLETIPIFDAVKAIALARLMMPKKQIKVAGGRLEVFKNNESLVFLAGASSIMMGNLLTIKGRSVDDDLTLLKSLGLIIGE